MPYFIPKILYLDSSTMMVQITRDPVSSIVRVVSTVSTDSIRYQFCIITSEAWPAPFGFASKPELPPSIKASAGRRPSPHHATIANHP